MSNFYVGDIVKVKVFAHSDEGTIVSVSANGKYYFVEFFDKHGCPFTYSYEQHELIRVETLLTKCECGAIYTWAPLQHSTWCPRHTIDRN